MEVGAGLSEAVMVMVCVLRDVVENKGTKPRGRERGNFVWGVAQRLKKPNPRRNPRAFICLA